MTPLESGEYSMTIEPSARKRAVLILYFAAFATMVGWGIITPALPVYSQVLGASGFWIGIIVGAFFFSRTLFLPVFGRMSDARGRRLFLLLGLSGYAAFSALYVVADSVYPMVAIRFLHGVAAAMVFPVAVAYVGDIALPGEEGRLLGGFHSAAFLGMCFGPLISGVLIDRVGLAYPFLALGLIAAATAAVCLVCLPDIRSRPREPVTLREVFLHPGLRVPVYFFLVYSVAFTAYEVYLPVITHTVAQFTGTEVGVLIFIGTAAMAVFQKITGKMADTYNKYYLLATGLVLLAAASWFIAIAGTFAEYLAASIVLGCGFGFCLPAVSALVAITGREIGQGSAVGVVNMAQGIGMMAVPVLFGGLMDYAGIQAVFSVTAFVALVSAPVLLSAGRAASLPAAPGRLKHPGH